MPDTSITPNPTEVTNISPHGFRLLTGPSVTAADAGSGRIELFLSFEDFPWFADATIAAISNVRRTPNSDHFYWPSLDADLDLDTIQHPEQYPLIFRR